MGLKSSSPILSKLSQESSLTYSISPPNATNLLTPGLPSLPAIGPPQAVRHFMPSDPFLSPMGPVTRSFQLDLLALFYHAATLNPALNPFPAVLGNTGESGLLP
jgi:hypothetical protein